MESIKSNLIGNLNDQQKVVKIDQYTSSIVLLSMKNNDEHNTGTHLDSHANMAVCGKHCRVIADTGFKADITAFSDEVGQLLEVPIVDALLLYENPSSGEKFILVVRNALHVPSMNHNLLPPFAMR